MTAVFHIGTSGWHYDHWSRIFYPHDLPEHLWLEYYAQHFSTVEINASFYRLPQEHTFLNWHNAVPENFLFAVKASRYITHIKKLKESREAVITFLNRTTLLDEHLGPILFQLPPTLKKNAALLEDFLLSLKNIQYRFNIVFEFRNKSWMDNDIYAILRKYNAGFCIYDMPGFRSPIIATTDYAYIRFHGSGELYGGSYSESDLNEWADRIKYISSNLRVVYVYFNNDAGGWAIKNAQSLNISLTNTVRS